MEQQIFLDSFDYDYLILGTGLTDSLFAACLAKSRKKIIVLDIDKSYSSSLQTLNFKELISLITSKTASNPTNSLKKQSIFKNFWYDSSTFSLENFQKDMNSYEYRNYNIDLQPKLLFSTSLTVDLMKEADMDKYMEFRAINSIFHFDNTDNKFLNTPSSKGQIFVHKDLNLLEKRTLFKTLQAFINIFHWKNQVKIDPNSTAEFDKMLEIDKEFLENYEKFKCENCLKFLETLKLQKKIEEILLYTLANCEYNIETLKEIVTTEELFKRMFKFVKSLGVHSTLPFLYTIYGTGDIPQAFARIAAVFGTTYIINDGIKVWRIEKNEENFKVFCDIAGENKFFTCRNVIVGMEYQEGICEILDEEFKEKYVKQQEIQKSYLLRMILIVEGEFIEKKKEEEAEENHEDFKEIQEENFQKLPLIYMIPPKNEFFGNSDPINLMIFGVNTFSTPKGKFIVYAKCAVEGKDKENYEDFSKELQDFLKNQVKRGQNEWNFVFCGGYIQEKVDFLRISEESGVFLIKNNDFNIDLDNNFKEFVENIGLFIPEFKENKDNGFFITKNLESDKNEGLEENESQENEITKLLKKLDDIVLSKNEEKCEKKEENCEKKEENCEKKEENSEKKEENCDKKEENCNKKEENCDKKEENCDKKEEN